MCGKIESEVGKEVDLGMKVINKGYFNEVRVLVIMIEYTTTSGGGLGQTVHLTATYVMCKEIEREVGSEVNVKIKGTNKCAYYGPRMERLHQKKDQGKGVSHGHKCNAWPQ